ncbi:MAG: thermonuclease family protein, partial [Deltaproteobacteria bacterium]|nr:thermonuclease family protein [Deltaproteobacteria bacterium]
MRNKIKSGFMLILLAILVGFPATSTAGLFKVVRVYDGDTIKAVGYDIEIKVRLVGIDAPETSKGKRKAGQPFGRKAEKYLARLVLNKTVDIKGYGSDRYGRILAEIYIDDKNVNLEMVKTGYAEVYSGRSPRGL